jgi:hypothetical protein
VLVGPDINDFSMLTSPRSGRILVGGEAVDRQDDLTKGVSTMEVAEVLYSGAVADESVAQRLRE